MDLFEQTHHDLTLDRDTRLRFRVVVIVTAGLLLVLVLPALLGRVYVFSDLGALQLPGRLLYSRCLDRGDSLSWCPYVHCGWDLQGAANYYHPVLFALYRCLPLLVAYPVELVAAYPIMCLGMYRLLRRWGFLQDAAAFGGMTLAFSGYCLGHFNHSSMILTLAHIPWLLTALDVLIREPSGSRAAWAWLSVSLLTASELLMGFPQGMWFSVVCEVGYVVVLLVAQGGLGRAVVILSAKLMGGLAGSLQLLLTYQSLSLSTRAEPTVDFVTSFSMHPAFLVQFLLPTFLQYSFDHRCSDEFLVFDGAITTVLCVWTVGRWRHLVNKRWLVAAAAGFTALGILLALGGYWPRLYLLQRYLPLVGKFRAPCRYIFFVHFGMAVLAAVALADLAKRGGGRQQRSPLYLSLIAVGSLIAWLVGVLLKRSDFQGVSVFLAAPAPMFLGAGLLSGAVWLTIVAARGSRLALVGILLYAAADRAFYLLPVCGRDYATSYQEFQDAVSVPPTPTRHRVLVEEKDCWDRPALLVRDLRNASGYAVLQPVRALDHHDEAAAEASGIEWVYSDGQWKKLANPVPYVRLVSNCVRSARPQEDLKQIDVHDTVLVQEDIRLPPGPAGTATLLSDAPGRLLIATQAASDRVLAVAESYHPGWQARIDGRPVKPLPLYGDLLGCLVPAGEHRVEFEYHSAALRLGTLLSLSGLLGTVATFGIWWYVASRRSPLLSMYCTSQR
ncbi:MAG: YfhO family protein [Planctomycetota bacterium]|nr:YfhO family protein [Planctomycetota bacterium]